jgi:hypothetical protein
VFAIVAPSAVEKVGARCRRVCAFCDHARAQLPVDGGASVCTAAAFRCVACACAAGDDARSVDGLASALKRAINYMTKAELFEYALQLTKARAAARRARVCGVCALTRRVSQALEAIYEHRRQYQVSERRARRKSVTRVARQALALMHKNCADLLKQVSAQRGVVAARVPTRVRAQVVDANRARSRHLGRYFRVALFGAQFGTRARAAAAAAAAAYAVRSRVCARA